MPDPVTTGELLLQRIADRLDSIDAKLQQGPARQPAPTQGQKKAASKKAPSSRSRADVDGR